MPEKKFGIDLKSYDDIFKTEEELMQFMRNLAAEGKSNISAIANLFRGDDEEDK